jgi:hypothetical protein
MAFFNGKDPQQEKIEVQVCNVHTNTFRQEHDMSNDSMEANASDTRPASPSSDDRYVEQDPIIIESLRSHVTSRVNVDVNGQSIPVLIDSGSQASLISTACWKQVSKGVANAHLMPAPEVTLVDFTGRRKRKVRGKTMLPIRIGEIEFFVPVYAIDDLNEMCIFGIDVLNQLSAQTDYGQGKLRITRKGVSEVVKFIERDQTAAVLNHDDGTDDEVTSRQTHVCNTRVSPVDIKFNEDGMPVFVKKIASMEEIEQVVENADVLNLEEKLEFRKLLIKYRNLFTNFPGLCI